MRLSDIDLEPYKTSYMFSNNPQQLLSSFNKIGSIELLKKELKPESIIQGYTELTQSGISDFDDLIKCYILVAVTLRFDYSTALDILGNIDLSLLDWGAQILHHYKNSHRETITVFDNVHASFGSLSRVEATTKSIDIFPEAKTINAPIKNNTPSKNLIIKADNP